MKRDAGTLFVRMFGDFEVRYNDLPIIGRESRQNRAAQVFEYLLCNRGVMIPQSELFGVLLGEEGENGVVILKNAVYRLRRMLEEAGVPDCIVYGKNAYGFLPDFPVEIDVEAFLSLIDAGDKGEKESYLAALSLYRGEFLEKGSREPWAMSRSVFYSDKYLHALFSAFDAARETGAYDSLLEHLGRASRLFPYEESVAYMQMSALYALGKQKEATLCYERFISTLYDALGVEPSDNLKELYKNILGGLSPAVASAREFRSLASEDGRVPGGFCCAQEVFKSLYQFIVRSMERTGASVFLMLCSLRELKGTDLDKDKLKLFAPMLGDALCRSTRRSDVYARYSPSQFVVMLQGITQENCEIVAGRVRTSFYKNRAANATRLAIEFVSAIDVGI